MARLSAQVVPFIHFNRCSSFSILLKRLSKAAIASAALRALSYGAPDAMKAS